MNFDRLTQMQALLDEGCDACEKASRVGMENAIWKAFPPDSKGKRGANRVVMMTGNYAKAAKLKEYDSIALSDMTDHQIQSVFALISKKSAGSAIKVAAVEGVTGYSLPFYAKTKTSDGEQWFYAFQTIKNGNFGGYMLDGGAAGRSSKKAKRGTLDKRWAMDSWTEVAEKDVPPQVLKAFKDMKEEEEFSFEDLVLDENTSRSELEMYVATTETTHKFFEMSDPELRQLVFKLVREGAFDEAKVTYAKAQADIMAGLEKEGWKVKRNNPATGKPMAVPTATSPYGDHKLFFKAQAIYLGDGGSDLGSARSLHLPDIRTSGFDGFASQLKRWTGKELNDQPFNKKPAAAAPAAKPASAAAPAAAAPEKTLTPDQYHAKHGSCPDGYHFDATTKRCVKAKSESTERMSEMRKLAGLNRYASYDRGTGKSDELFRERAGITPAHSTWTEADVDEDADLWHPDKDVKNAGHPMNKPAAKAAPADKHAALLKALKCGPGKEAKVVYGRPSCVPVAKS